MPARNTIFLSLALGWAEVLDARDLVIGVNALDYSGYPDCRPEFIAAFEALASVATRAGVEGARFRVHTPLIRLTQGRHHPPGPGARPRLRADAQLLRPGRRTAAPAARCDSCVLRARGFAEAGAADPLVAPRLNRPPV